MNEEKPLKQRRGFGAMTPERQREIARQGGKAAHAQGKAHQWNSEQAKAAGKKGGDVAKKKKQAKGDG